MPKKEKMILAFLFGTMVLLGCGLGFLTMNRESENLEILTDIQKPVISIAVTIPTEKPDDSVIATEVVTITSVPVTEKDDFVANTPAIPEPSMSQISTQRATVTKPKKVGCAFWMTVQGKDIFVAYGVDEATLEKTPGWLPTSAKPGEEGTCVVYGHRNKNHLRALEGVKVGDIITVALPNGKNFFYTVNSVRILEREEDLRLPLKEGRHLVLTTCYPFYYNGHAPKKIVVTCIM